MGITVNTALNALLILLAYFLATTTTTLAQSFDRTQQALDDSNLLQEVAVTIGNVNGRLWEYSKGGSSTSKIYESASSIKWVTSVVILRLVEEGTMSLEDTPGKYLGYWEPKHDTMTVRQLLAFTSGFRGQPLSIPCAYNSSSSIDECAERIYNTRLFYAPGTNYFYGPAHMLILASMAQNATGGTRWQDIFESRVARVIGMTSTSYGVKPTVSGGGSSLNANDLDVFCWTMLQRSRSFLSERLWNEMLSDQTASVNIANAPSFDYPFHYGLGVWRECLQELFDASCESLKIVSTTGGTGPHCWVDYESNVYGVITTNGAVGMGKKVLHFAINTLRPAILADMTTSFDNPTVQPSQERIEPPTVGQNPATDIADAPTATPSHTESSDGLRSCSKEWVQTLIAGGLLLGHI